MTTNLVVPTESQLPLAGEKLTFQEWKKEGEDLVRSLRDNEERFETSQWDIGDWIVRGVENKRFNKTEAYNEAQRITGFDREYLQTVVWVVNRFPAHSSLRKETRLKWSHFKELAYIRDAKLRENALDHFNQGFEVSVRQIREYVQELAGHKEQDSGKKEEATEKHRVSMQVSGLTRDQRRDIKTLAALAHKEPDKFLRQIVMEYLERKDIAAKLEKAQRKSKR